MEEEVEREEEKKRRKKNKKKKKKKIEEEKAGPSEAFWKRGCGFFLQVRHQPQKSRKSWKSFFSRHGVGISSYITNLYNEGNEERKKENKKKYRFSPSKGGCGRTHRTPPPPLRTGLEGEDMYILNLIIDLCN